MGTTSTIADFFTRIRNAIAVRKDTVEIPASRIKIQIASVMKEEGFISDYEISPDQKGGKIKIHLKYFYPEPKQKISVIRGIQVISKPGRRIYLKVDEIPQVYGGTGTLILSTSKGIMSSNKAKLLKVGGEAIAKIW
ncbi:MAG: 30S ribosomal protein S8 [Candidatus Calescibacterium sp.]|nr:30S ribosomal protein S8 [Candidatus Calescibacterium sp.]MCX7734228.1 30S ribosomal protein S8 [bacterium]MDW8087914.1 30S ribosomal protein S8 [Candidatus Calescibacterium sp.]